VDKNASRFSIDVSDRDDSSEAQSIHDHLRQHIELEVGASERCALTITAKDDKGVLLGGARGFSHWRWLYISHLWVDKSARSLGLGAKLISSIESEAKTRSCAGLYVDTFSPKARDFYIRQGFEDFGRLDEMPLKGARYYLKKRL
jgi:GNAT superfamily N-acetyltransferase